MGEASRWHSWVDGRLNLSRLAGADRPVQIPKHLLERLWRPRLVFSPAKAIRILSSHLEETHRTVVSPDQIITVSHKVEIAMYCTMDLFYYPVDTSLCDLSIINVESDDNEFVLRWIGDDRSPFRASKKSIDFDPKRGTTSDSFVFFPALPLFLVDDLADGKRRTRLVARFAFQRKLLGIMMDPLVPSVFPVVLSWTGFWLGPHAAKTRAILVSLCMVLQTFQQSGFVAPRHHNRHIQTVDVWFVACHVFIIASLLELVLVSNAVQSRKSNAADSREDLHLEVAAADANLMGKVGLNFRRVQLSPEEMDDSCKTLFPASFVLVAFMHASAFGWPLLQNTDPASLSALPIRLAL
ncbi:hypothetical protein ISCGN_027565 [Ixodes scapularis]